MTSSSPPKPHALFQVVAVVLLAVVAGNILLGCIHRYPSLRDPFQRVLTPILAPALWGFLLWKLWQQPRKWGLGIGILLLLMLIFQTWLMAMAVGNPHIPKPPGGHPALVFALDELPIAAAAVACLALRFVYPHEYPDSGKRLATSTDPL